MINKSAKLLLATVVAGSLGAGAYSMSSMAHPADQPPPPPKQGKHMKMHPPMMPWRLGLMTHKNLTSDEAKTITQAALLMYGRKDLKVGKITVKKNKNNEKVYVIEIINDKDKVESVVNLDSGTGFIRPA